MDRYIEQLIDDILQSERSVPPDNRRPDDSYIFMDELEAGEAGPAVPLAVIGPLMGLPQIVFPPAGRLTEKQAESLVRPLETCLKKHGFMIFQPPVKAFLSRYRLLRRILLLEVPVLPDQYLGIDVCDGLSHQQCPLGESACDCYGTDEEFEPFCNELQPSAGGRPWIYSLIDPEFNLDYPSSSSGCRPDGEDEEEEED